MRLSLIVVALCMLWYALCASALAAPPEKAPRTVLVTQLRALGVEKDAVATIIQQIAEHLSKRPGLIVTTLKDVKDVITLEKQRKLVGCEEDAVCVSNAASALNTDLVVAGSVGKIGKSFVISLVLVDTRSSSPLGRASETVENLANLPATLPKALSRMFGRKDHQAAPGFKLPKGKRMSFAVFNLTFSGVSKEAADNLTQILSTEIKRVEGTRVISREDIVTMLQLEQNKYLVGCTEDSCVAEIGGALGVDRMVVGKVGKLSESYVVSLRLINPRSVKVDNRVTETFRGSEDQLIRAVRNAGRRLLGIGADAKGSIAVSSSEEDAEVYLDDQKIGKLPMPPVADLGAGRHVVRLTKEGYLDWQSEVYVDPSETTAVWAQLNEKPGKWYQKWWVWTIVGAVVAGGVTGIVLAAQSGTSSDTGSVSLDYVWESGR